MFPSKKISHKRKIVSFQNKNFQFFRSAKIFKKIFLLLLNFYFSSEHLRSLLDSKVHLFKFQELLDPLIYFIWIFKHRFFKKVKFYFFFIVKLSYIYTGFLFTATINCKVYQRRHSKNIFIISVQNKIKIFWTEKLKIAWLIEEIKQPNRKVEKV